MYTCAAMFSIEAPEAQISISAAHEHNLNGVCATVPHQRITVVCGVSGSGKSTLVREVLYRDSLMSYRSALNFDLTGSAGVQLQPDVDHISGNLPAVFLSAAGGRPAATLTVAEVLGVALQLRRIWRRLGEVTCPECAAKISSSSAPEMVQKILERFSTGARLYICAPFSCSDRSALDDLLKRGFSRVIVGSEELLLDEMGGSEPFVFPVQGKVVVDRMIIKSGAESRIQDSVQTALNLSGGQLLVFEQIADDAAIDERRQIAFSLGLRCSGCNFSFPEVDLNFFRHTASGELRDEVRYVEVNSRSFVDIERLTLGELNRVVVPELEAASSNNPVLAGILRSITAALRLCFSLGIEHLPCGQSVAALSEGELYLLRLATLLSIPRTQFLYIFDEPSSMLSSPEVAQVVEQFGRLVEQGNTVLAVDHARAVIECADHIIELGPGAGSAGGECVFQGTLAALKQRGGTATAEYLFQSPAVRPEGGDQPVIPGQSCASLTVRGARLHTLKNIDISFPLNRLTAVCGVSGSGKTALVFGTLVPLLEGRSSIECHCSGFDGPALKVQASEVAVTPKNNRSCPATYSGVFDEIRKIFSLVPDAGVRGFGASSFSFNSGEEVCRQCGGSGLHPDSSLLSEGSCIACSLCNGARFNGSVLDVRYRGLNIQDVLELDVAEAAQIFANNQRIAAVLDLLAQIGLGYLRLGQPLVSLSQGELQRMRLARNLKPSDSACVYVIDEPCRGLHPADVRAILTLLRKLVAAGNTVITIERNPCFLSATDWVIELGPAAGVAGGYIVSEGPPV